MWLILAPSESRMRRRPWYAPPFQDWSVMDPGVSSATRSAGVAEESLPFGLALAGRQPLLMRVKAASSAMWIGVENLTRNRRCAELKAVLGMTYRPVGKWRCQPWNRPRLNASIWRHALLMLSYVWLNNGDAMHHHAKSPPPSGKIRSITRSRSSEE